MLDNGERVCWVYFSPTCFSALPGLLRGLLPVLSLSGYHTHSHPCSHPGSGPFVDQLDIRRHQVVVEDLPSFWQTINFGHVAASHFGSVALWAAKFGQNNHLFPLTSTVKYKFSNTIGRRFGLSGGIVRTPWA